MNGAGDTSVDGWCFRGLKDSGKVRHKCRLQFVIKAGVIYLNAGDILLNGCRMFGSCVFLEGELIFLLSRISYALIVAENQAWKNEYIAVNTM